MELNNNQKNIIKLLHRNISLIEILKKQLSFKLNEQDISNIRQHLKIQGLGIFDEVDHYNSGIILTLEQIDELNKNINDINNLLKLLEIQGLIKIINQNKFHTYVILNKEKNGQYVKDKHSEISLMKFEQQSVILDKYFSKFAKTFRTKDEEKKYKDESFNKFKNGKFIFIITLLSALLGALGGPAIFRSCSVERYNKEKTIDNKEQEDNIEEQTPIQEKETKSFNKVNT